MHSFGKRQRDMSPTMVSYRLIVRLALCR
uniref:Uncharacterized protein n=1 Tax=Anguilla anguilla TaxID=7936 RepID=A0A0E9RY86_ANGAN